MSAYEKLNRAEARIVTAKADEAYANRRRHDYALGNLQYRQMTRDEFVRLLAETLIEVRSTRSERIKAMLEKYPGESHGH